MSRPVIFISATNDLRSARKFAGSILCAMGYEPVWQEIEPVEGGELLQVLRDRLAPCGLVLQLVGDRYGAEPPTPTEFGRLSYTQYEAVYAESILGLKVIYCFLDPGYATDPTESEPPEKRDLQAAYRQRVIA